MSHDYTRPGWDCGTCGQPWPCAPAKVELAERFPDPTALRMHLLGRLYAAAFEIPGRHRPVELRNRFLEWTEIRRPSPRQYRRR